MNCKTQKKDKVEQLIKSRFTELQLTNETVCEWSHLMFLWFDDIKIQLSLEFALFLLRNFDLSQLKFN